MSLTVPRNERNARGEHRTAEGRQDRGRGLGHGPSGFSWAKQGRVDSEDRAAPSCLVSGLGQMERRGTGWMYIS